MMTTLVHRHPERYLHKSRFTRYLQESIYLSIDKPTSLYPMYHRKKHLNPTLDTPAIALRRVL